jgi:hypothetical protein
LDKRLTFNDMWRTHQELNLKPYDP